MSYPPFIEPEELSDTFFNIFALPVEIIITGPIIAHLKFIIFINLKHDFFSTAPRLYEQTNLHEWADSASYNAVVDVIRAGSKVCSKLVF